MSKIIEDMVNQLYKDQEIIEKMKRAAQALMKASRPYALQDTELRKAWYGMRRTIPIKILDSIKEKPND